MKASYCLDAKVPILIVTSFVSGIFACDRLCRSSRGIHEMSRSEIAFAVRAIPSRFCELVPSALMAGRARASCDDPHLVEKWEQLTLRIQELKLNNVCTESCLIDGDTVRTLLGVEKSAIAASINLILQASLTSFVSPFLRIIHAFRSGSLITLAAPRTNCSPKWAQTNQNLLQNEHTCRHAARMRGAER
jgi:hypothetical protein